MSAPKETVWELEPHTVSVKVVVASGQGIRRPFGVRRCPGCPSVQG